MTEPYDPLALVVDERLTITAATVSELRRMRDALVFENLPGVRRVCAVSPNSALQRAGTHKVLGRGRPILCASHGRWPARVLMRWRAVAELCS
mgnify:CR=1 FL=1